MRHITRPRNRIVQKVIAKVVRLSKGTRMTFHPPSVELWITALSHLRLLLISSSLRRGISTSRRIQMSRTCLRGTNFVDVQMNERTAWHLLVNSASRQHGTQIDINFEQTKRLQKDISLGCWRCGDSGVARNANWGGPSSHLWPLVFSFCLLFTFFLFYPFFL